MPELPEVHTITTDLESILKNALITSIVITSTYSVEPSNEHFVSVVSGSKILTFERVAKNIIIKLDSNHSILIHLAMTGKLLIRKPKHLPDPHLRTLFNLVKNNKEVQLRFCDMRMFGRVKLLTNVEYTELRHKYGPEPIDENLSVADFYKALKSKKTNIKNVLLDQSIIAGLGNVYATDALWLAKIHPETNTQTITLEQATELLQASRDILNEGIKNRGISMSDYVDAFGRKGNQQNYFRIYQQDRCFRCAAKSEFITLNGRGTYFCPLCQIKDNQARLI